MLRPKIVYGSDAQQYMDSWIFGYGILQQYGFKIIELFIGYIVLFINDSVWVAKHFSIFFLRGFVLFPNCVIT